MLGATAAVVTIRVAVVLVTLPAVLLTWTLKVEPLSPLTVASVV